MSRPPVNSPSCPSGSRPYACIEFTGCCTTTACNGMDGCPFSNLELANFNPDDCDESQSQDCPGRDSWWSCVNTIPPLLIGSCKSSPCSTGCPRENGTQGLIAYYLIDYLSIIGTQSASAASSSTSSLSSSPTSTNIAPMPTAIGQSTPSTATPAHKSNTAAIAGGVAGGVVGLAVLVALLAICCRRRITRQHQRKDGGKFSAWSPGQVRAIQSDDAELEEVKQGQAPTSSPMPPHPPLPLTWPSPPPPEYTPYGLRDNELDRSPDVSQPPASSPYLSHDIPSPDSPPSPPPLKTRRSQNSADCYSDTESVSPISSHYQHQPFDETGGLESSMYSEVSSSELLHTQITRPS